MRNLLPILLLVVPVLRAAGSEETPPQPAVVGITINGLRKVSEETVRKIISAQIGKPLSPSLMDRDFMALWRFGSGTDTPPAFIDVSIKAVPVQDGVILEYNLKERPVVTALKWRYVPPDHHLFPRNYSSVKSLVGQLLDESKIRDAVEEIRSRYLKSGYIGTRVDWEIKPVKGESPEYPSKVTLIIRVEEGKRFPVNRLYFEGVSAIPTRELLSLTKKDPAFSDVVVAGTPKAGWWEFRAEIARYYEDYLRNKGLLDAEVEPAGLVPTVPGSDTYTMVFTVKEGPRYRLGRIRVEGNENVPSPELLNIAMRTVNSLTGEKIYDVSAKPGHRLYGMFGYYSPEVASAISDKIRVRYRREGRIFTQVRVEPSFREQHIVDILIKIKEDAVRTVNRIEPRGNSITKDKVIRREFALKPGDKYDEDLMARTMLNLYNLDLFKNIVPRPFPVGDDKVDIMFDVTEGSKGSIQAALSYSGPTGVVGQFSLNFKNFDITDPPKFLGGGEKLSLEYMSGSSYDQKSLSFSEPYFLDKPITFSLDAYDKTRGYARPWTERENGVRLGFTWRKSLALFERRFLKAGLSLGYYDVRLQDIDSGVPADSPIRDFAGRWTHSLAGVSFTYDAIDSPIVPTSGYRLRLYGNFNLPVLGGEWEYLRYGFNLDGYVPLTTNAPREKRPVLSLRLHVGGAEAFGGSDVPVYDRFFAGGEWGEWKVRGFETYSLSPKYPDPNGDIVGGKFAPTASAEMIFPLAPRTALGVLFLDAGNTWAEMNDFDFREIRTSAGFGIRFTPYGFPFPIGLYWAWPLNAEPGDDLTSRFILTLGIFY